MLLLVPADPLSPRSAGEHFRPEALAARAAGVPVALVHHDQLTRPGEADAAVRRVPASADAVYRAWMLRSEQYAAFATALAGGDVTVRTSARQYQQAHELPGWYDALRPVTPQSWISGAGLEGWSSAASRSSSPPRRAPGGWTDAAP